MRFLSFFAGAVVLSASLGARANVITVNYTANGSAVLNNDTGRFEVTSTPFARFDTSAGTLNSITVALSGNATYTGSGYATFDFVSSATNQQVYLFSGSGGNSSGNQFAISSSGTESSALALSMFEGMGTQALALNFSLRDPNGVLTTSGVSGTLTYDYTPAAITATPEPSSIALLGTGVLGIAGVVRKRFRG